MNIQHRHLKKISLSLALLVGLTLSSLPVVVLAQEPAPFEITVIPAADFAVSGQPFTYTVVVTNVSQVALQNIFVNIDLPKETEFVRTGYTDPKWFGGNAFADPEIEIEQTTLFTPETIQADEVFSFTLTVEVFVRGGQEFVLDNYEVTDLEGNISISGPMIKTKVLAPTPTPTPSPMPTPTATSIPKLTSTPAVIAQANPDTPSPSSASPTAMTAVATSDIRTPPSPTSVNRGSLMATGLIFLLLVVSVGVIIGLGWFLRRK